MLKNIIYIQNIEFGEMEAITTNNKTLTLKIDRIESIIDDSLFEEKEE